MCDATTLISSKQTDLHSCWIIYTKSDGKERLTVADAKSIMPNNTTTMTTMAENSIVTSPTDDTDPEDENDGPEQSFHEMLDPELQPEPPITDNPESQAIYREHRRLAKQYLRVDTKLYYAQDFKEKLLAQIDPTERQQKQELLKKMSEKEELLELYNNLKQQLEKLRGCGDSSAITQNQSSSNGSTTSDAVPSEIVADDGWVVIAPHQNT